MLRSTFARIAGCFLLASLAGSAHAAFGGLRVSISEPAAVADNVVGQTLTFHVAAVYDPVLVDCLPTQPDCNRRQFTVCVAFRTVPVTASNQLDFIPVSGSLVTTVVVDGPDVVDLGSVTVPIVTDALTEGTETFRVELSNVGGCISDSTFERPSAVGRIVDGAPARPDLLVSDLAVARDCSITVTLQNAGDAPVPDSAYHATQGAAVNLRANGLAWGGMRLHLADPARLLKTPGASVSVPWFPGAANLELPAGTHALQATVDANGVVVESVETNNVRSESLICRAT